MFLRNIFYYTGANFLAQGFLLVQGFVVRHLLAPQVMGVWNFVAVVRGYVQPMNMGVSMGAQRLLPLLKGQGDTAAEERCRTVALGHILGEGLLACLGTAAFALFYFGWGKQPQMWATLVVAVTVPIFYLQSILQIFFQGAQLYVALGRVLFVNALVYSLALMAGAYWFGLTGVMVGAVAAESARLAITVYLLRKQGVNFSGSWDWGLWKRLVSFGVRLRICDLPFTVMLMLDLLWVGRYFSFSQLALYAMARVFLVQTVDGTTRMGNVFYTRMVEQYGQGRDSREIGDSLRRYAMVQLCVVYPLVFWLCSWLVPALVGLFIPLYGQSVELTFLLLMAGFFHPQVTNLFSVWLAEDRPSAYGVAGLVGVAGVAAGLVAVKLWGGSPSLSKVALAVAGGYAVHAAWVLATLGRELWGGRRALAYGGLHLLAAGWTTLVLRYGFGHIMISGDWQELLGSALLRGACMLAAMAPLMCLGLWVSGAWKILKGLLEGGRGRKKD